MLLGQVLETVADPFRVPPEGAMRHTTAGAVLVDDGHVLDVGPAARLIAAHPEAARHDYGAGLILPGFVDAHVHYPQTGIVASWGKRLIDWLNAYTFPEEMRFADPAYAAQVAECYFDLALANGITTACSFCTIHPASVDALMAAARARGMRMLAGRVMMDRNAPDGLTDTAQASHDESAALIARWHGVDRLGYAISPRFAPTSSPAQLEAAGALWAAHPDCALQTHLSEQREEVDWVRELYPAAVDYFGVYEGFGLAGPGAVMGHAIHLSSREWPALAEGGSGIAHCPTSNTFIGSGLFDLAQAKRLGIPVGLGTDTGGGSSFSMLRTMAAAYEIGQLRGYALHPAQLLWLATAGGAEVLRQGARIGRLAAGYEADLVVLDLASTPAIAQRQARARDIWEAVFPTIMMGDDRAVRAVWIGGRPWAGTGAAGTGGDRR